MVFVKEVPKLLSDCVSILNHKRSQEKATWKVKYETAKESKELIVADIPLQKFQLYIFSKHYAASNWKEKKSFAQNQRSMMIWKPGKKRKSRTHLKWSYQFPRGLRQTKGAIDRQKKIHYSQFIRTHMESNWPKLQHKMRSTLACPLLETKSLETNEHTYQSLWVGCIVRGGQEVCSWLRTGLPRYLAS